MNVIPPEFVLYLYRSIYNFKRQMFVCVKVVRMTGLYKWLITRVIKVIKKRITKALISLCRCAGWSEPLLFANC